MKKSIFLIPLLLLGAILFAATAFVVNVAEQVIVTNLGRPIKTITAPGLYFKVPFVQDINRYDNRILEWDGKPLEMVTKDKIYVEVDTFARWRISDLDKFFIRLRDERSAESRLTDILASTTMSTVAQHEMIELIRTTPDRKIAPEALPEVMEGQNASSGEFQPIKLGRVGVEAKILQMAKGPIAEYGVELIDIRFKRLNYDESVARKIHDRMISERRQIAERYRSEGAAMAARILGDRERDLQKIQSEGYKTVQTIQGEADAKATEIYAKAFNQSPEAAEFYGFQKSLETYERGMPAQTTLLFSTDSDIFKYLKSPAPTTPPVQP
jgi:modulator of FtsH protease HflC